MSVLNINSNNLKIIENVGKKSTIDYSFLADKGDILEGKVVENNKVVIDIDGEEIVVDNATTSGAKVGDIKQYEVMESSKSKLVLKELEETSGVNEKIDINSKINSKQMQLGYETQEIKQSFAESKEVLINNEMRADLTEKLDKTVATLSPEDIRAIEEDGKSIEEMDIKEIYNKLSELKKEKKENSKHNCGNVDKFVDNFQNGVNNSNVNVDNLENSSTNTDIVRKNTPKMGIIIENTNFKDKINEKIQLKFFDEPMDISEQLPAEISHVVDELYAVPEVVVEEEVMPEGVKLIDYNKVIVKNANALKKQDATKLEATNIEQLDKSLAKDDIIASKNVSKTSAVDAEQAGCITKDAIKYIMVNELDHTLDNLYKAKFAGSTVITHNISDEDFSQLLDQVKDVIETAGYDVNDENIGIAKWIIESDIPFTVDTFTEYFDLMNINKYSKEDMMIIANDYVMDDVPIKDMFISYVEKSEVEDVINSTGLITEAAIEEVVKKDEVINLKNLLTTQRSIDAQLAENANVSKKGKEIAGAEGKHAKKAKFLNVDKIMGNLDEIEKNKENEAIAIRTRKQLEEIRLKLTLEAGNKLALKGFNIATEELSVVVEELTNIEKAFNNKYANALKDNYDGQKLYDETVETVSEVKAMSGYVLAATYSVRDKITVAGLYEEGNKTDYKAYDEVSFKVSRNLDRFNETFETIMTAPRKDMGDSIAKAFRNVDEILTDLGMETTDFNRRAVRILGYNNTDITRENISEVKLYDYEVNKVLSELTPAATVELIKRGNNPLNMPLAQLGEELAEIKASIANENDDNYSKFLWKLDRKSELSAKERDAYIGIYRLIHQVEKSDGAVVGAIMNSGKELTLRNLLVEARVRQKKGVNVSIDELFGAVETVTKKGKAIDSQISEAFTSTEMKLSKNVLSDIAESITPEVMSNALVDKMDIMNTPIEQVLKYIEEQDKKQNAIDKEYYEYKIKTINEIADKTSEAVKLLTGLGMETTMNNVIAASDTLTGNGLGGILKKFLKQQEMDAETMTFEGSVETIEDAKATFIQNAAQIIDAMDDRDRLNYAYTEIEDNVKTIVEAYKDNYQNSEMSIEELRNIHRNITFVTNMSRKENYEIPVITNVSEESINITNVNLTIIRNSGKHEVSVNFESELLGKVEAKFTYKNDAFKGLILADNTYGLEKLKDSYNNLKDLASEAHIAIKQLDYGINNKINYTFAGKNNGALDTEVSTRKLYSLSKALLVNIRETEQRILAQS